MASSTGKKSFLGWVAAGTLFGLGIGGLSFAVASSRGGEEIARVERVRAISRKSSQRPAARQRRRVPKLRASTVRADQFGDLVAARRELFRTRRHPGAVGHASGGRSGGNRPPRPRPPDALRRARRNATRAHLRENRAPGGLAPAERSGCRRREADGPPVKEAHATSVPPAASDAATTAASPRARSPAAAPAAPSIVPARVPAATSSIPKAPPGPR